MDLGGMVAKFGGPKVSPARRRDDPSQSGSRVTLSPSPPYQLAAR